MRGSVALAYRALGLLALGLAVAGVILPGVPATPFLLLAAWAFGKGAPQWAERMHRHPRLGPYLTGWAERRAVPPHAKFAAVSSMAGSFAVLWWTGVGALVLAPVGAILVTVSAYLLTRPSR